MSRTFLQLCQDVASDLGVSGGILQSTTSGINQEQQRMCNWVARADLLTQNLWTDWNFLWAQSNNLTVNAGANNLTVTPPSWASNIQSYDLETMWCNPGTSDAQIVPWMDWDEFYPSFVVQPLQSAYVPSVFSVDPSMTIWFAQSMKASTAFAIQYWCVGNRMTTDSATSRIPNNFDDIIVERAKLLYAQRENAPEVLTGSSAEYTELLDKMQAYCLPRNRAGRTSKNRASTVPQAYVE